MNMFRNLLCLFLIVVGVSLMISNPSDWAPLQRLGPDFLNVVKGAETFRPFVIGACFVIAVALFMTRKQY
jgi:ABC-type transport system involved in cytochrome bd biosynthesis fused ATPase/permease subunit